MNKLVKQSNEVVIPIIQNWDKVNQKIVIAHYEPKIQTFFALPKNEKNQKFQELHQLLIKWSVLVGVKPVPTNEELKMFVSYIAEHFHRNSIMEIDNAFSLATAGKLNIDVEHYQSFSVIYISKIINAYKEHCGKYVIDYKNLLSEKENEKEMTEEEKTKIIATSVLDGFDNYKKEQKYNPFGYVSYDFLTRIGVLKMTDEKKGEILIEATALALKELKEKQKVAKKSDRNDIKKHILKIQNDMSGKDDEVIRVCKNLSLYKYYDYILENNISLKDEIINIL